MGKTGALVSRKAVATMRYRLRTLLILIAVGPPMLAVLWFLTHSIVGMLAWALFVAFFGFWFWQLRKRQTDHPRTRGYPNSDTG